MKRHLLIITGLLAIIVAAFWGLAACGFVNLDDPVYILENPHVTGGLTWTNFKWAWTTFYAGNYLPLTWVSLMLDVKLFGSAPRGFHWVNLAFHATNAILIYLWFSKATGAIWRSALVAAIFAVHPLRVESVAWIVERKDVLTAFFGLLAMLAYLRFARSLNWGWYAAVVILFAASLLAKQTLSTLPFLLLVLDYWPLGRWIRGPAPYDLYRASIPRLTLPRLILEKLPLLLMTASIAIVTVKAQQSTETVVSLTDFPMIYRLANAPISYVRYLGKMVWFGNLGVFYPLKIWNGSQVAGACALLVAITALALARLRSSPWLAVGWLWFLGVLFPMIGLVQFSIQSMADRFTYMSSVGVLVMIVWSIPAKVVLRMPVLAAAATATVLGILCLFTLMQIGYWRNSLTLFTRDIEVAGSNLTAENNLGSALIESGDAGRALPHLRQAVRLDPTNALVRCNLADALIQTNRVDDGYRQLATVKRLDSTYAKAYVLSVYVLNQQKKYEEAEQQARILVKLDGRLPAAYNILGLALRHQGKLDEAADDFRTALALEPGFLAAQLNLKEILAAQMGESAPKPSTDNASTRPTASTTP